MAKFVRVSANPLHAPLLLVQANVFLDVWYVPGESAGRSKHRLIAERGKETPRPRMAFLSVEGHIEQEQMSLYLMRQSNVQKKLRGDHGARPAVRLRNPKI